MSAQDPLSDSFQVDPMMMDLFKVELETQAQILSAGLLELERQGEAFRDYEPLMRAAHSIKGAGRIVNMEPLIHLSHDIEDVFVSVKSGATLSAKMIDTLLRSVDLLAKLSKISQSTMHVWLKQHQDEWNDVCRAIQEIVKEEAAPSKPLPAIDTAEQTQPLAEEKSKAPPTPPPILREDRILRVTAQNLNRLMGLAGEAMVESRWLEPFSESLTTTKNLHLKLADYLDHFKKTLANEKSEEKLFYYLHESFRLADKCRENLAADLASLELFIGRNAQLSTRLYGEVIDTRMRPFADCLEGFSRMVRDLAKQLNKKVRLEIFGKNTPVDRDILEKLEAPLGHLLRNAVDHGIETPQERVAAGKSPEGKITLEAQHRGRMLLISISDDGQGINLERLRQHIVERHLIRQDVAQKLSESELLEFLLLPGFSTAKEVTDISGRGVGLNVVQNMVHEVAGTLRILQTLGKGTSFYLQLPLTLSVMRALIVEICGDPYAFPLSRVDRVLEVSKSQIETIEGRQYFPFEEQNIGVVPATQVLELEEVPQGDKDLSIVVFSDRHNAYGVLVDKLLGQRELVVHELDARLKKIQDVQAAALMEDGSPIFILDVEDMVRSIHRLLTLGKLKGPQYEKEKAHTKQKKRILVVDDSITVREVEARLLRNHGYDVETAVNGVDGWNAARVGEYDLVISDVDMPRMNGIELVRAIRSDARLKSLPVMIVSYKEREDDRLLGLEAGANYYLTKSCFHDETLLHAVIDLIGE